MPRILASGSDPRCLCQLRRLMVPEFPVLWTPKISLPRMCETLLMSSLDGRALTSSCFFTANKDHQCICSVVSVTSLSPYRLLDNIVTPPKA